MTVTGIEQGNEYPGSKAKTKIFEVLFSITTVYSSGSTHFLWTSDIACFFMIQSIIIWENVTYAIVWFGLSTCDTSMKHASSVCRFKYLHVSYLSMWDQIC